MVVMDGRLYFRPDERLEALTFTLHQIQRINRALESIRMLDKHLDTLQSYLVCDNTQGALESIKWNIGEMLTQRTDYVQYIYQRVHYG